MSLQLPMPDLRFKLLKFIKGLIAMIGKVIGYSEFDRVGNNFLVRGGISLMAAMSFFISASYQLAARSIFDKVELEPKKMMLVATLLRRKYALTVIEQLSDERPCWTEMNKDYPVILQLDLLDFNFSGICGRATDSGGYSIRMGDEDLGLDYKLGLLPRDEAILLVGTPDSPGLPEIIIGQTHGISGEPMKIFLNPGWRMTKRAYEDKILGHYYFTHDSRVDELLSE